MHSVKYYFYSTPKVSKGKVILRGDAFLKFLFKIRFKRETNLKGRRAQQISIKKYISNQLPS